VEILRGLSYRKQLLSEKQIRITFEICRNKKSYREIAQVLEITEVALRKYLEIIRKKFIENDFDLLCLKVGSIQDFDLSLLWKNTQDYLYYKEHIYSLKDPKL